MKRVIMLLSMIVPLIALSQKTITGKVVDASTNKPLASASIIANGSNAGVTSGNDGTFTLKIDDGIKSMMVSYTGYGTRIIKIEDAVADYLISLQPVADLAELIVIGSRNLSRTKVQTPVPVDVIPVAKMAKEVGQTDLNQLLTYSAPSFQSTRQTTSDGTDHLDPAQLRALGTDQVLVLVNGKRRHQSALVNVNGTVNRGQVGTDLNAIPLTAIERVEILRDGAAAQYGSDAIAGVMNIVLKKNTNTLSGNVSYGENITSYHKNYAFEKLNIASPGNISVHDGGIFQAGLNYGIALNKKGFINLTGEYSLRNSSNRTGTYTGPAYANIGGANKDDSILNARGLTRDKFDMHIGNSRIQAVQSL